MLSAAAAQRNALAAANREPRHHRLSRLELETSIWKSLRGHPSP